MIIRTHALARWVALLALIAVADARAAVPTQPDSLGDLSLEQLGDVDITTVSGKAEHLSQAPASIYVITADDIRRFGARTLPEALRLAPNLEVARVDASTYAISARGFNNSLGNKLLVLIDGRIVYTHLFSGVFWDAQDVMLEDVDRIEVISGPGATLWGANAVNGVINVITKDPARTQGLFVGSQAGSDGSSEQIRYGGGLGGDGHYRVYAQRDLIAPTQSAKEVTIDDGFERDQAGFRADWGNAAQGWSVEGDTYRGQSQRIVFGPVAISGFDLMANWNSTDADGSTQRLLAYIDHTHRDDPIDFVDTMNIVDVEYQHGSVYGAHDVLWGLSYRDALDATATGLLVQFIPAEKTLHWEDAFAQDTVTLTHALKLTLGARVDRNVYTGNEFMPSLRLAWQTSANSLVWADFSRAVREPSRIDKEFFFPGQPPFLITGGPNFIAEVSDDGEIGFRAEPTKALSFSVTLFDQYYQNLRSGQPEANGSFQVENGTAGRVWGGEAWGTLQVGSRWRVSAGLTELREGFHTRAGFDDPDGSVDLGNDPRHQWSLRSTFDVTQKLAFNVQTRSISALPVPAIAAYTAVDASLDWRISPHVDVAVFGWNLLGAGHVEYEPGPLEQASDFDRSADVRLQLRW